MMSQITQRTISFSVDGPSMTHLAREFCYKELNLPKAFELLWELTNADELSEGDHLKMVVDILNGKANIVGTYPNDDYGVEKADEPVKGLKALLEELVEQKKQQEQRIQELTLQRNWLLSCLQEDYPYSLREYFSRYKEDFKSPMLTKQESMDLGISFEDVVSFDDEPASNLLSEFLERQTSDHDIEKDYGWLEPNGRFHIVPWGEHYNWARDYIQEHFTEDGILDDNMLMDPGDYLQKRGWVLLHSPAQGLARTSLHPTKRYTKAQQDFLYSYYIDRNHPELANEIMQANEE